jgi:serine/threonine-protein kinase
MSDVDPEVLLHASVRPGEVLAGKYTVDRIIGSGGMGVVVVAVHVDLGERVALKFLLPAAMQSQEAVARFSREARAAFKIKSEHVARVIDVGQLQGGIPYMVMEYLDGSDLDALVQDRGKLPVKDAVEYILQACEAIAEAHTLGIIHRDLKPANLFLTRRPDGSPCIKVLDFGLSKVGMHIEPARRGASMTSTRQMLGSPVYMPPEQMLSPRDVDVRSDIWSLGVILFELLTAQPPFMGDSLPQLQGRVLGGEPQKLTSVRPDAPPGLEAIIEKCLQKDRANRFANVADLTGALVQFGPMRARVSAERVARMVEASGQVVSIPPPPAWPDAAPSRPNAGPSKTVPDDPPSSRRDSAAGVGAILKLPGSAKGALAGGFLAAALLGALLAGLAVSRAADDAAKSPSPTSPVSSSRPHK